MPGRESETAPSSPPGKAGSRDRQAAEQYARSMTLSAAIFGVGAGMQADESRRSSCKCTCAPVLDVLASLVAVS